MARGATDALARVPLFEELSSRHLRRVAELMQEVSYHDGAPVVTEGQDGDSLYMIVEGEAKVMRGKRSVDKLLPGDVFGEISLLDGGPRTATVVASTPLRLLEIRRDPFRKMLEQEPGITVKLLGALAKRFRRMSRSIAG